MKSFIDNGLTVLNISGCEIRLTYIIFSIRGYTQNRNYYQFFGDVHFSEWRDLAGASISLEGFNVLDYLFLETALGITFASSI